MFSALFFLLLKKVLVIDKIIINIRIDAIKKGNELNVIKYITLHISYLNNMTC